MSNNLDYLLDKEYRTRIQRQVERAQLARIVIEKDHLSRNPKLPMLYNRSWQLRMIAIFIVIGVVIFIT